MSTLAEKLKKRRREEQEIRGYANSSRWYTGLSNAISFLERAETATDPLSRFSDAWAVAYNLFMMHGEPGDEEFRRFNSWVSSVKDSPGVRHHFVTTGDPLILAFRQAVERVKNILLKPQGLQELQSWAGKGVSPEKACRYFFTITRDIRNTAFHPGFNPTAPVKKAIGAAADCLLPIVAAAVEATIEHPVPNTTGKATAYRFFLYPFLKNSDGFFSDYYLERLFPDEELGAFPEDQSKELFKQISKQSDAKGASLQTADGEGTLSDWLDPVLFSVLGINAISGVRVVTEDAVFQPNLVLPKAGASGHKAGAELKGKDAGKSLSCMIWTLPWRVSLDSVATEPPFTSLPITEVVHRALAASEVPWAIITNGRQLRLLSRVTSHKPRCFLEADLVALIDRRTDAQAGRAFRFLLGLFSGRCFTEVDAAGQSLLDRVAEGSDRHGKEIGDELKANVFSALQELGEGFLDYLRANPTATSEWRDRRAPGMSREKFLTSDVLLDDIYHESLSLMYRLLFLFYAESRELLPLDNELYQTYSLESIRDDVHSVQDDPDPKRFYAKGNSDLWTRLKELFGFLDKGWGNVIPPYNGGLFDPKKHKFLETFAVGDYYLARAIDLLSRTKPRIGQNRGEGRKKVTYRDLDVRHLGSIYEGILEYTAHIADQEYVILREGSGASATEQYVAATELNRNQREQFTAWAAAVQENPENPRIPRGCKVNGSIETGQYYLAFGGRDSKRKSSGSYYTPDYVVQYIIENTLGPLIRGECRPKPEQMSTDLEAIGWKQSPQDTGALNSSRILELKVLDPAMGSGHFLVAATEFLARAYRDALFSEGLAPDEVRADQEFIRYKRIIAERCIYGVDLNPMAVELAKLSMWLFTMDPGRPLSFLDHHLKCGSAVLGAWVSEVSREPELDSRGKPLFRDTAGQAGLFEHHFKSKLPLMLRDVFDITRRETLSIQDVEDKKTLERAIEDLKRPFGVVADTWTAGALGLWSGAYLSLLTNLDALSTSPITPDGPRVLHWELEFPEVWFDEDGSRRDDPGFDAVVANPPWGATVSSIQRSFLMARYADIIVRIPNSYMYFVRQSERLMRKTGAMGFVLPDTVLAQPETQLLRDRLSMHFDLTRVVNLGSGVFLGSDGAEPTAPSCILCMVSPALDRDIGVLDISSSDSLTKPIHLASKQIQLVPRQAYFNVLPVSRFLAADELPRKLAIAAKCYARGRASLGAIRNDFSQGITTGGDYAFVVSEGDAKGIESTALRRTITGSFIEPYALQPCPLFVIYTDATFDPANNPGAMAHLAQHKAALLRKVETVQGVRPWFALHRSRDRMKLASQKIVIRQTGDHLTAAIDRTGLFVLDSVYFITVLPQHESTYRLEIIEALLNSSAWNFLYRLLVQESGRVFPQVKASNVDLLPVPLASELADLVVAIAHKATKGQHEEWKKAVDQTVSRVLGLTPGEHAYMTDVLAG